MKTSKWIYYGARPGTQHATAEDVIDVLRSLIDTGVLHPDDVLRDVVLPNELWRLRYWRRIPG